MTVVCVETEIAAPPQAVFDAARSLAGHEESMKWTGERVVERPGHDLLEMGDVVTFEAVHFGLRQRLTGKITAFSPPHFFEDTMLRGAFKRLTHRHEFVETGPDACTMVDIMDFNAPLGVLGRIAELVFLASYMRRLLVRRAMEIKRTAEDAWG